MSIRSVCVRAAVIVSMTLLVSCGGSGSESGRPPPDDASDADADGIPGGRDNCPLVANADQRDDDGDGEGNACDLTPGGIDFDGDGVPDGGDNCPSIPNGNQSDRDGDGRGDVCDDAPDGRDSDGDGRPDSRDNCPFVANPDQADDDGDGRGNVCETAAPATDNDGDGVDNERDNCPTISNGDQSDADADDIGDACDPTPLPDIDGDGVADAGDNCIAAANADQRDTDDDGEGDACDDTPDGPLPPDGDGDGVPDERDNCPDIANEDQSDRDDDDIGDVCDDTPDGSGTGDGDRDGDGVPDARDNCPDVANPDQSNRDDDELGDVCDPSDDRSALEIMRADGRFGTFLQAVSDSDLQDVLGSAGGTTTVFAPIDDAFDDLDGALRDVLLGDPEERRSLVQSMIVTEGIYDRAALAGLSGQGVAFSTLNGYDLSVEVDGEAIYGEAIGDTFILEADLYGDGAVIHAVDFPLSPLLGRCLDDDDTVVDVDADGSLVDDGSPIPADCPNAPDRAGEGPLAELRSIADISTFVAILEQEGLADLFEDSTGFTWFVPTNEAMAAAGIDAATVGIGDIARDHVFVVGPLSAADLAGRVLTSSSGAVEVFVEDFGDGTLTVNGFSLIAPDVPIGSSIIHLVDGVLFP